MLLAKVAAARHPGLNVRLAPYPGASNTLPAAKPGMAS